MIFFFYGPNTYAARQQIASMRAEYIRKSGSDIGIERIEAAKIALGPLTSALQASPFLAASRLVVVEDLGQNKGVSVKAAELLALIPSTTVAVFYDPAPDQRTTYFKTMSAGAKTFKFELLSGAQLSRWVKARVSELGASIDVGAIHKLLDVVGDDQWRLSSEIAKLAAYQPEITREAVDALVQSSEQQTIFNLIDQMMSGNTEGALRSYQVLRGGGMHEMQILNMVQWQLRNALMAKAAGKISPGELAKKAGMSPFVASKAQAKVNSYTQERINEAFLKAVDTEYRIKSGQGQSEVLVEQLIYYVTTTVSR